ncbi:hypothetical protein D3C81_1844600 [compost metagenome]
MVALQPNRLHPCLDCPPYIIYRMIPDKQGFFSGSPQAHKCKTVDLRVRLADPGLPGDDDSLEVTPKLEQIDFAILDIFFAVCDQTQRVAALPAVPQDF